MNPLETYIQELREIRSSGEAVPETSYYPVLSNLLNEIGKGLKPKVRCVISLKNRGAGLPDGGLFTKDQLQKATGDEPLPKQMPARGVIEVKPTSDDAWLTAEGKQVSNYWRKYGQVLVTNYRDFLLLGRDEDGNPKKLEAYRLAGSEADFWKAAEHPVKLAKAQGEQFAEYLKRVMTYGAPLAAPKDLAWLLASYAREARIRIEPSDLPALIGVRTALEEALGLKFEGEKGDHFFRSTFIQTLFYGVFSAWVLWAKHHPPTSNARFNWHETAWYLRVPMIRVLFEQVAAPTKLGPLGLEEVLDWTGAALNRVDRAAFFSSFEEGHAVQYFYEPFLHAFDPKLRKELGVWYTPPEIVQYMVARVETVLRKELGIPDGLADPRVYVLDPCAGTGSYLVEVLRRIGETLREKGGDALLAADLKRAAMERVFGFEILPAPFVVAHLQLGLLLQNMGAPLSETKGERAGFYLTNALTGWEPPKEPKSQLVFPELQDESKAAAEVKREKPILVVIGNPPYNAFAGVSPKEEQGLVEPYKEGLSRPESKGGWGIKKFNLDDLYVRFFRLAERRIAEMTGKGVVCYISNFSYLGAPSFVVMRQKFLSEFDKLWFDCMNGDSRETGKLTPEGKPDPSVFSTEYNRVGIRVGTAIGLIVRGAKNKGGLKVRYRDFWGVTKKADLLESLKTSKFNKQYEPAHPEAANRFSFRPENVSAEFRQWPSVPDLCQFPPTLGVLDNRQEALIRIDRDDVEKRAAAYLNPSLDWQEVSKIVPELTRDYARFPAIDTRVKAISIEPFTPRGLRRVLMRPMDVRWCYYTSVRPVWMETRPALVAHCWNGNRFLMTRRKTASAREGAPVALASVLGMQHALQTDAYYVPLRLAAVDDGNAAQAQLFGAERNQAITSNLSKPARAYLAELGIRDPDADAKTAELIWMHALAIGYSPAYLAENEDGIRNNWPRVPLPDSKKALLASAKLGRQVADLLDTESPVPRVTSGKIRPELRPIAVISREGGGNLNLAEGDLDVTAGWGYGGQKGVTMPGKGKVIERDYTPDEREAICEGAELLGLDADEAVRLLGEATCDVFLNDRAYWKNIPSNVWNYFIGGYQVIKKWLSYREKDLVGRPLTLDEAREVTNTARRIAALLLLQPKLDANYEAAKKAAFDWGDSAKLPISN